MLLVLLGALVACRPEPVVRGVAEATVPSTLDPLEATTLAEQRVQGWVFDRLYERSEVTGQPFSRLVAREEPSTTGLRLVLRSDVRWHDGVPLTPADVCFTVDTLRHPEARGAVAGRFGPHLAGCSVDGDAAVVELTTPSRDPRDRLGFPVLPAHGLGEGFGASPLGTGPLAAKQADRRIQLRSVAVPHRPSLPFTDVVPTPDPFLRMHDVRPRGAVVESDIPLPLRHDLTASGARLHRTDDHGRWFLALNTRTGLLADVRVRRGVVAAVDREALAQLTVGVSLTDPMGPCEAMSGPFPPSSPFHPRPVTPPAAGEVEGWLSEAGATQKRGRWSVDGEPIHLRVGIDPALQLLATDLGNQLVAQLERAGLSAELVPLDAEAWTQQALPGLLGDRFDLLIGRWTSAGEPDPAVLLGTRDPRTGAGRWNLFNHSDAEVDRLLDEARGAPSDTGRQAAMQALHRHVVDTSPIAFLWSVDRFEARWPAVGAEASPE